MAQSILISKFKEIKPDAEYINVHAKVVRKWERPDLYSKKYALYVVDLILMDAQTNVIQATVRKGLINKFNKHIEEGKEYRFTNMEVSENTGPDVNKVSVDNTHRLFFSFTTRVGVPHVPTILHHGFRFRKFQDILEKNVSDRHYLDVIGELTSASKVTLSKNKGEKLRTVELTDLNNTVLKCSVWGDYTDEFSFADDWNCNTPMICVIQNVQRTSYNGEVRVTTTRYATQISFNNELPEVEEYRERNRDLPVTSLSRISELTDDAYDLIKPELIKTLAEIVKSDKAGYWVTLATIENVDLEGNWYYFSCKTCYKGAVKGEGGKLECKEKCQGEKRTIIIPRFQTKFVVKDSIGTSAKVTVFENHISKEIKLTASEILDRQQNEDVPQELEAFIGREFVFKLEVSRKSNVDGNRTSYTAADMTDDKTTIARWKDAYAKLKDDDQTEHESGVKMADKAIDVSTAIVNDQPADDEATPPLKRPFSRIIEDLTEDNSDDEISVADQQSTTKKFVKVKVEKV